MRAFIRGVRPAATSWVAAIALGLVALSLWLAVARGRETHHLACRTYDTTYRLIIQGTQPNDRILVALGFTGPQIARLDEEILRGRAADLAILGPRDTTCPAA